MFGEWALFDSPKRDEYAEAVEPSTVVLLPTEAVQRLTVDLRVDDTSRSYHVPLLLAPFGLTSYRGS